MHQGLSNFHNGQAFLGGFGAFAQTFVWAFYSYGGVELVSLAAGETAKPHKTVPRAIKATFFRIVVFYILAVLTIGLCINNTDETLLNAAYGACIFYYWCSFRVLPLFFDKCFRLSHRWSFWTTYSSQQRRVKLLRKQRVHTISRDIVQLIFLLGSTFTLE